MSEVLKKHGYDVLSTDIVDRGYGEIRSLDFLDDGAVKNFETDNIITNPPFKVAKPFVEQALRRSSKKVAILERLAFLESIDRYSLFKNQPFKAVYVFSKRLSFYPNGNEEKKRAVC